LCADFFQETALLPLFLDSGHATQSGIAAQATRINVPLSHAGKTADVQPHYREGFMHRPLLLSLLLLANLPATAANIGADLLTGYRADGGKDFTAAHGEQFFRARHGDMSCTSCHTDNTKAAGKHAQTGKLIEPLAPSANPKRLSDPAKVEKWFKRNCNDVLKRACTAQEKGDFVTYLLSIK
jgi:hypothetical protein